VQSLVQPDNTVQDFIGAFPDLSKYVDLDDFMALVLGEYEEEERRWRRRIAQVYEKHCGWYKLIFGNVLELEEKPPGACAALATGMIPEEDITLMGGGGGGADGGGGGAERKERKTVGKEGMEGKEGKEHDGDGGKTGEEKDPNDGMFTILDCPGFKKVVTELGLDWDDAQQTVFFERTCELLLGALGQREWEGERGGGGAAGGVCVGGWGGVESRRGGSGEKEVAS
jgi:hypothetical protein